MATVWIRPIWRWVTFSRIALLAILTVGLPSSLRAGTFPGAEEAAASAFPGAVSERETFLLSADELEQVAVLAGQDKPSGLIARYVARKDGEVIGYAYLDKHRVRTLPEVLMIAVNADGTLQSIQVLAFREPLDYMAPDGWFDQFTGMTADDEIRMKRNIDGITGATLTARATTQAARRVLAVHAVVERRAP